MNMDCVLCGERITDHPSMCAPISTLVGDVVENRLAHRECMVRSVTGGIGHLEDHDYWCVKMGDPDGGRTYRQSAIEVAARMNARYN